MGKIIDLTQHVGSSEFYRHGATGVIYTEGIMHLAEEAGAFWLIDKIATEATMLPSLQKEAFLGVKLIQKPDSEAVIQYDDGNYNVLYTTESFFTDFPFKDVVGISEKVEEKLFFFTQKTLMLPSEY